MIELWHRIHGWSRGRRWGLKVGLFLAALGIALYPKFWLIPTWASRLSDMDAVLDADHPGLVEFEQAVRSRMRGERSSENVLAAVQEVVTENIAYAWDWDVWGVMDYLPTVDEVLQKRREDCDGQAVLAASLLRRMGFDAHLASDLVHTWVVTPEGATMSPGGGQTTLVGGRQGTQARWSLGLLGNAARALSFGVAVFPLGRELFVLAALCAVCLHPWSSTRRRIMGCLCLAGGLFLLRACEADVVSVGQGGRAWLAGLAAVLAVGGWLLLVLRARGPRPHSPPTPTESPSTGGSARG